MKRHKKGPYELFIKRWIDIAASFTGMVLFGWLYLACGILVRIFLGKPVFFRQPRPGRIDPATGKEKIFMLIKFRTMTDEKDKDGNLLSDEKRLPPFGRWLRQTSLDEIPELFNILKGDMSFIGPRPLLVRYLDRYTKQQRKRHLVRPGLTGYAQVHGRNSLSWEDRFAMDVWYVKNITFINDLKIVIDTVKTVLSKKGVSSDTSATMEEFMGTPKGKKPTWSPPN